MRLRPCSAFLGIVTLFTTGIQAQHEHHMHMAAPISDSLVWRMPPMDMSMPMMPGLEKALPPSLPSLPQQTAMGITEAQPNEVVPLADGDTLHLAATLVRRQIGEKAFVMYGYNNQYPGPLISVTRGATITVLFHNAITEPTTIHWHGLRLDNRFDGISGLTQAPVDPESSFTYTVYFPDTGLYWYHPHLREDMQQDLGLYGNMVVHPEEEDYYSPVNHEETLIIDDILVDQHGMIPWGQESPTHALMGRFGNVMLTNGTTDYSLTVARGSVVRFMVTNVANARTFNLNFGEAPVKVVASDVSKFEREVFVDAIPISPSERYIVEVLFENAGTFALTNSIQAIDHFRGEFYPHTDTLGMITVTEVEASPDYREEFSTLRTNSDVQEDIASFREHFDRAPDKELSLTLRVQNLPVPIMMAMEIDTLYVPPVEWNDAMPMMNWLSTGSQVTWIMHEPSTGKENMEINWDFTVGDVIKVRIFNDPSSFHPMHHPVHVHGQRFLVLEMDGVRSSNLVWKDTAVLPVGSTMDILIEMSNPGQWMAHCHIAEHLSAGMMIGFNVHPSENIK